MPLYEYSCQKCGGVFEVIQKFSDAPLVTHEGCGGKVERLLSPPALQFKGTGWYVTDYAGKNGQRGNGKSSESKKSEVTTTPAATPAKAESKASDSK